MHATTTHPVRRTKIRLLALLLGGFLAFQPAVRANACGTRSLLLGLVGRACCCGAMRAAPKSCCASAAKAPSGGPVLRGESCRCGVSAPLPEDALPRSSGAGVAGAESCDAAAGWIAKGACASAATACFAVAHRCDPPPGLLSPLVRADPFDRVSRVPGVVARACVRGVNGLLAVLGVARL